jgi:acyl-coenzyme A synthetase/AMP-(fatty) acid ligase
MYRTGDMAEIAEDGEMYFAGRKDFQIKHMGHRIELEEIERGINALTEVERSICTYNPDKKRITAYYTGEIDKKELHMRLKEKLPVYMVPNRFNHVKEFRLNKNGKVDRKVLDELEVVG